MASFTVEGRGSGPGRFREVAGVSIVRAVRVSGRQFNSRQPSGLNNLKIDREMFSGSVDACFVFALPFRHGDLEPNCL